MGHMARRLVGHPRAACRHMALAGVTHRVFGSKLLRK